MRGKIAAIGTCENCRAQFGKKLSKIIARSLVRDDGSDRPEMFIVSNHGFAASGVSADGVGQISRVFKRGKFSSQASSFFTGQKG